MQTRLSLQMADRVMGELVCNDNQIINWWQPWEACGLTVHLVYSDNDKNKNKLVAAVGSDCGSLFGLQ